MLSKEWVLISQNQIRFNFNYQNLLGISVVKPFDLRIHNVSKDLIAAIPRICHKFDRLLGGHC